MSKICKKENCNNPARYGLVNPETGMFEKHHCKIHKQNGQIGKPPLWQFRYPHMKIITANRNVQLLDSEEEFIEKTKKDGCNSKLKLLCNICNDIVTNTNIDKFIQGRLGCSCFKKIPYTERYQEVLENCESRNIELLDTEAEYIEKTKKYGQNAFLKLKCNVCLDIVNTTNIHSFINQDCFGCSCNNKIPYSKRYLEVLEKCKIRNVKLLDTEEEYIQKTEKDGHKSFLNLLCLICNTIVTTTNTDSFMRDKLGCSCNKSIPYHERYLEVLKSCQSRNIELLYSEEEYIEKTKKYNDQTKLKLKCNICLYIVDTTTINNLINHNRLGCLCYKNVPWHTRYPEFLEVCKNNNVLLLDSETEFIEKTKINGKDTKLNLQCLDCNTNVSTTCIINFIRGKLGCKCSNSKSEKCLSKLLEGIFPDNKFIKIKPDWIKNKQDNNLELDFYCEYLKLALEYQGIQHEQYHEFYHKGDINNFYKQQEHDRIKKKECEKKGIKLICIPSKYDYTNPLDMCEYILDNL